MTFPSRIELKACSQWTIWPPVQVLDASNGTKHYWLIHFPGADLWLHWEVAR